MARFMRPKPKPCKGGQELDFHYRVLQVSLINDVLLWLLSLLPSRGMQGFEGAKLKRIQDLGTLLSGSSSL